MEMCRVSNESNEGEGRRVFVSYIDNLQSRLSALLELNRLHNRERVTRSQ